MILIKIILNERVHATNIIETGYVDKHPKKTAVVLARYYLAEGYNTNKTEELIHTHLQKYIPKYNSVMWDKDVSKIVNQAKTLLKKRTDKGKKPLVQIERVHITLNELNRIKQLNSIRLEKLAFSLLVYAKLYNQINEQMEYWVNAEFKEIFSDAALTDGKKKEQNVLLHKLIQSEYIEASKKVTSTSVKVLFADETDEIIITLEKFDDFIYEYLRWKGEKVGTCKDCARLMLKNK